MSILTQIQIFFKIKTNAALDALEDPRQTLEYTDRRQSTRQPKNPAPGPRELMLESIAPARIQQPAQSR